MNAPVYGPTKRKFSTAESVLLLASEDVNDLPNYQSTSELGALFSEEVVEIDHEAHTEVHTQVEEQSIFTVPNLFKIEIALLVNVSLAAFDSTVTASTYTIIGSEFNAVHLGSWITTSYLITSTSFQPLYGTFSDVLGRRICYFFATVVFTLGCLGCSLAPNIFALFCARAFSGVGGAGLVTLATVVNSDIIPASKRGLFQGFQNILIGVGSTLGAALGGWISENFGWKYCFLAQVPISTLGMIFGYFYIEDQSTKLTNAKSLDIIDFRGALLLVSGLTLQLLSLNSSSWTSAILGVGSLFGLFLFVKTEISTKKSPIINFKKIKKLSDYLILFISLLTGFANFAYIFILPLLFQIILGDSPSRAGLRLGIPSLFTSVGSLITAYYMNKDLKNLKNLFHCGVLLLLMGNSLALLISKSFPERLLNLLLVPANTGLGMSNPALLFTFVFRFPKSMQASSTSTLYLFRAIGNVWGVAIISTIIQYLLRSRLESNFQKANLDLSDHEISIIIEKVLRSLDYLKVLPSNIRFIVQSSYEVSIRDAQTVSVSVCVLCLAICILRDIILRKSGS